MFAETLSAAEEDKATRALLVAMLADRDGGHAKSGRDDAFDAEPTLGKRHVY